jgi:ABC-type phosphate/phosphonate transport system substrate-binding protein
MYAPEPGVAALPMYALPGVQQWQEAWWAGLARHFKAAGVANVPERLSHGGDALAAWSDPNLVFAQACGYPLTHAFAERLQLIATPCYDAPGCVGAGYRSFLIVRADSRAEALPDVVGGVAAINDRASQSGCNALRAALAEVVSPDGPPPFARTVETGSHLASLQSVAHRWADICAVDCVTHALLHRHAGEALAGTRVLGETPAAPGLPYVTGRQVSRELCGKLAQGLFAALEDPELRSVRAALAITGAERLTQDDYGSIPVMAAQALAAVPSFARRSGAVDFMRE